MIILHCLFAWATNLEEILLIFHNNKQNSTEFMQAWSQPFMTTTHKCSLTCIASWGTIVAVVTWNRATKLNLSCDIFLMYLCKHCTERTNSPVFMMQLSDEGKAIECDRVQLALASDSFQVLAHPLWYQEVDSPPLTISSRIVIKQGRVVISPFVS